ncbi:hypothetical protein MMC16_004651 [Acarospora aff. strigata]|nr:hypothetical protein [Acarospora aff. strigata]
MRPSSPSSSTSSRSSTEPEETMQIFVKLLSGETIPLSVPPSTSIETLKQLLSLRTSIPPPDLRLVHAGKHLLTTPSSTLTSLSIPRESTLHLTLPVRGGMPPKKIKCNFKDCKDSAQRIVGDCGFCQGHFCGKHRMLEDHRCSGLEDCKKESHERNANKLNSERTTVIRGI